MGLLGDILGEVANAAIEKAKDSMGIGTSVGILFENNHLSTVAGTYRAKAIEALFYKTASLLGLPQPTQKTQGKHWDILFCTNYEGTDEIDAFVISNGQIVVSYGLCGMGQSVVEIEGINISDFVNTLANFLSELDYDSIQPLRGDIPFHEKTWIETAKSKLALNSQYVETEREQPKIQGDKKSASILLEKLDEIFLRDVDDIFDTGKLMIDTSDSTNYIITDGNISVKLGLGGDFSDDEVGHFIVGYRKNSKTLFLGFTMDEERTLFNLMYEDSDKDIEFKFHATFPESDLDFSDALDYLEEKHVEIPEDFCSNLHDFIEKMVGVVSELSSRKFYADNDYGDDDDDLVDEDVEDVIPEEIISALNLLELTPENASIAEIKVAYRNLAKEFHPDRMQGLTSKMKEIADLKMKELNDAYALLLDFFDEK